MILIGVMIFFTEVVFIFKVDVYLQVVCSLFSLFQLKIASV